MCTATGATFTNIKMGHVASYGGGYTLSEAWSGVNWADLMAAFGTDFYDRSILRPKHRAYYRSGRPVIKIGPKGALGSHEIRPIHSAPSLGQSIHSSNLFVKLVNVIVACEAEAELTIRRIEKIIKPYQRLTWE